jgi:hypothetical protein
MKWYIYFDYVVNNYINHYNTLIILIYYNYFKICTQSVSSHLDFVFLFGSGPCICQAGALPFEPQKQ